MRGVAQGTPSQSSSKASTNDASKMWRSSTQSANHAKQVLENHKKALATGLKPSMPTDSPGPRQGAANANRPPPNQSGNPFLGGIAPP